LGLKKKAENTDEFFEH